MRQRSDGIYITIHQTSDFHDFTIILCFVCILPVINVTRTLKVHESQKDHLCKALTISWCDIGHLAQHKHSSK